MERKRKESSLDSHTEFIHSRPLGGLEGFGQEEVIGSNLCCGKTVLVERMADYTEGIRIPVQRATQDCQSEARRGSPLVQEIVQRKRWCGGYRVGFGLQEVKFQGATFKVKAHVLSLPWPKLPPLIRGSDDSWSRRLCI